MSTRSSASAGGPGAISAPDRKGEMSTTAADDGRTLVYTDPAASTPAQTPTQAVAASQRGAEIAIASLFLVTAAARIPAAFALDPILSAPDYLARVFPNKGAVELGPCCGRSTTSASCSS